MNGSSRCRISNRGREAKILRRLSERKLERVWEVPKVESKRDLQWSNGQVYPEGLQIQKVLSFQISPNSKAKSYWRYWSWSCIVTLNKTWDTNNIGWLATESRLIFNVLSWLVECRVNAFRSHNFHKLLSAAMFAESKINPRLEWCGELFAISRRPSMGEWERRKGCGRRFAWNSLISVVVVGGVEWPLIGWVRRIDGSCAIFNYIARSLTSRQRLMTWASLNPAFVVLDNGSRKFVLRIVLLIDSLRFTSSEIRH